MIVMIYKCMRNSGKIDSRICYIPYSGALILEHVSEIMADICNNNYINISCPPLTRLHVLK